MKTYDFNREIYPNLDLIDLDEIDKKLKKYNIELIFLFDEGISINYDDTKLYVTNFPGDISFYKTENKKLVVNILENFGNLEFYNSMDNTEPFFSIPILEKFKDA